MSEETEQAAALEGAGPEENEENAQESSAAAATAGAEETEGTAKEGEDEQRAPGNKKVGGFVKKLNRAEQERDFWREEALRNREAKPEEKTTEAVKEATAPRKPNPEKKADGTPWKDWDEYEAAKDDYYEQLAEFKARRIVAESEAAKSQKSAQQKFADEVEAKWDITRKAHADFNEVALNPKLPITADMAMAVATSDLAGELAYYLGSNPEEVERIAKLHPAAQARAIGVIEAHLASDNAAAATEKDEKDEKDEAAATTRAPRPPIPVRKTTAVNTGLSDELPYKEWERRRNAEIAKRH